MRINDTLKKAAGLIFEFDEPTPEEEFYKTMSSKTAPKEKPFNVMDVVATPTPAPAPVPAQQPVPKTAEQVVRESPGPNLNEIKVPATVAGPVVAPDGKVDFNAIYNLASLPTSPFTAEQVLEMLASLPAELPMETKRATIKVTLGAVTQSLGVNTEAIVADASRKLAALAAYAQSYTHLADEFATKTEVEITNLEAEITRRRQAINDAKGKQSKITEACHCESDRLDDVLEFFSLDVAPSKYA